MKQNKDKRITIRLSPEQYESITDRASTALLTPSAYIRAAVMRHKVTVINGLPELTRELKGIGRNLNQLAVLSHEGRVSIASLDKTAAVLAGIYDRLGELVAQEKR